MVGGATIHLRGWRFLISDGTVFCLKIGRGFQIESAKRDSAEF